MRILKKKSAKNKNLIVLDIGTQFLKAIVLEVDKERKKGILHSWAKERISADLNNIYPICQKAITKAEKKANIKGEELFLGVNCEIAQGVGTTFCFKREKPKRKIDSTELKYLVQKVQWKAFDKIRKSFALETGLSETKAKLVNANIIDIKIDNSSVANPLGFQGEILCLTIFNTYTSSDCLEKLIKLADQLELELIGISPSFYALFNCFDLENQTDKNALIIDVGGKITEVGLIKNGGETIRTKSFNLGGQVFTRTIADFLELKRNEAEIIKIKYAKGELSSKAKKKLQKLLSSSISSWLSGIKVVLDDFSKKHKSLPLKIFLCGGGSKLPGIKEALKKKSNFQVKSISPQIIIKVENRTKLDNIPCLALADLALKSSETTMFSSTLKRVMRLIQE